MRVELKKVRLAFFQGFKKKAIEEGGKEKFSTAGLMAPDSKNVTVLHAAAEAVAREEWPSEWEKILQTAKTKDGGKNYIVKDGDQKEYDGYPGNLYVNPTSDKRPTIYDRDGTPLTEEDGRPYSGCYADLMIEVYAYAHKVGGKGVTSELKSVRFREDGDAFSGGAPVSADQFSDPDEDDIEL